MQWTPNLCQMISYHMISAVIMLDILHDKNNLQLVYMKIFIISEMIRIIFHFACEIRDVETCSLSFSHKSNLKMRFNYSETHWLGYWREVSLFELWKFNFFSIIISIFNFCSLQFPRIVDEFNRRHLTPEFKIMNAALTIPLLVDGQVNVFESNAIAIYLVEKYGKDDSLESLYPKNLEKRTKINEILFYNSMYLFSRVYQTFLQVSEN